jgi:iron complex outermembrane receptor protein
MSSLQNQPISAGFLIAISIIASMALPVHRALAQTSTQTGTELLLEEVIVTARKREESLQDAPIAISAYSGQALEYRGTLKLDEISKFVPSLTFENNPSFGGASNSAAIYIRGVGQKEFLPTTEPGVGLYVDDVYVARSVGAILDMVDIERVEVLRGPQGTLFGRNTIGGAISITTQKPAEEFGGSFALTAGTDNRLNVTGFIDMPISATVLTRLSIGSFSQDGYVERTDGLDLGDDDTLTGRFVLNWTPSDAFAATFRVEATQDRENGPAMQLIDIDFTDLSQLNGVVLAPPPPMAFIHNVTTAALGPGMPCAATDPAGNGVTFNPASPNCFDARYIGADGSNEGTAPAYSDSDLFGISANLSYTFQNEFELRSITAYRDLDAEFARDGDHSPQRISQFLDYLNQSQFTQEFQLLGTSFDDRLQWILGLYYFNEDGSNSNILDFTVSNFRSGGAFDNESAAIFAQGTFDISDRWHLTVGGRYTDESKVFLPDQIIFQNYFAGISQFVPPGNPLAALDAPFLQAGSRILPNIEKQLDISEFTPMLSLSFDATDSMMMYASYSEGFKSGGFTQRVFPPIVAGFTAPPGTADIDLIPTFEPEFVNVVEAGLKMTAWNDRLRMNAALFHTDYEDLQVQVFNSVAPVTQNIGAATINGVELEFLLAPGAGWFLETNFSYLDPQYDEIDTGITLIGKNFAFERVPDFASNVGLSKEIQLKNGSFTSRVDWSYRSETFNDSFNSPQLRTPSYSLFDLVLTWRNAAQDLSLALNGKNLTDEEYLITGVYGTAFQVYEGVYDRGRQWFFTVRKSF